MSDAKKYQAFYTKSTPIVDYMISKLQLKSDDRIFEPCGGDGVFVEAILDNNQFADIDICELNNASVHTLVNKFSSYPHVSIRQCDTLLDEDLMYNSNFGGIYDKIIANPPYGAWQEYDKRAILKKLYPNLYTKETYALFLFRCIELLKDGGILSFIIPDTFLNLHMHKEIRHYLLTKTKIIELSLFPSSFFPGINFGYANLSIITLQKSNTEKECLDNVFRIITGFTSVEQLSNLENEALRIRSFEQREIITNSDYAFFLSDNSQVVKIINTSKYKIGDIANCVTGFYSGDDKTYLQVANANLKNGKNYQLVDYNTVNRNSQNLDNNILDGIEGYQYFLPIVKGGSTKYLKPESWFMNWSKKAVAHYKKDKKARFQNSQYYFKYGIAVPMISSSSITASLIENKLFDQSIVGIFPKDKELIYFLLAFFNSPTCNKLIRTAINPSANNPANYIKKIPFIMPDKKVLELVTSKISCILNSIRELNSYDSNIEDEVNNIIMEQYGF
jgi:adenine-specific DNA-methyltransferase